MLYLSNNKRGKMNKNKKTSILQNQIQREHEIQYAFDYACEKGTASEEVYVLQEIMKKLEKTRDRFSLCGIRGFSDKRVASSEKSQEAYQRAVNKAYELISNDSSAHLGYIPTGGEGFKFL